MKRFFFLCILLCLSCISARAQRTIELNTVNGLSSSLINCLFQDSFGDIWIGTENGLNRYNGVRVRVYKSEYDNPRSLSNNNVSTIMEDSKGNIIVGTQGGVQIYFRDEDCFSAPLKTADGQTFAGNVNSIVERRNGEIWVSGNSLFRIIPSDAKIPVLNLVESQLPNDMTGDLFEDESGDIWMSKFNYGIYRLTSGGELYHYKSDLLVGAYNRLSVDSGSMVYVADNHGNLVRFDREKGEFVDAGDEIISGSRINALLCIDDNTMYIGTDGKGIYVKDFASGGITQFSGDWASVNLGRAKVHDMIRDREGNLWIGIYQRGVVMIPPESSPSWYLGRQIAELDRIGSCCTTSLLMDSKNRLWVGTDNDGIYRLGQTLMFEKHYSMEEGLPGTCFSLMEDTDGDIWFGTYSNGFWRIDPRAGKVQRGSEISGAQVDDISVYSIVEDSRRRVWLGCMGHYLCYYDKNQGKLTYPDFSGTDLSKWILDMTIIDDILYIASYDGLFYLDIKGDIPVVKKHLLQGKVIYALEIDADTLYCCTSDGFCAITLTDGKIASYSTGDGLADNRIHDARVVEPGKIWFSTGAGLSQFDASSGTITNYYPDDGFLVSEFSWKTSEYHDGKLYFGGSDGITILQPDTVRSRHKELPTRIVEIQTEERNVPLNADNRYTLDYNENFCTVSFTTEDFNTTAGVVFKYSTDGKTWIQLPLGQQTITLSKLTPGDYDLMIRAVDRGYESEPLCAGIRVLRPWWSSMLANILFALAILLAIYGVILLQKRNRDSKKEIERYEQSEQANEEKVKFFINLSHEIRSPLTLISAPLEKLIETDTDPGRQNSYSIMDRNVKQILNVVNQMLDVRKLEKGMMKLSFSPVNLVDYIASIVMLFKEQAGMKGLELGFRYNGPKEIEVWLDPEQFDKVIVNFLSNAIKYTPEGGSVNVTVSSDMKNARIEVKDTGVGLTDEELGRVFDRFYQSPNAISGTGIGLNLAKMMTERHHGTIEAGHNPSGQGCIFSVTLPLGNAHLRNEEISGSETGGRYLVSNAVVPTQPVDDADEPETPVSRRKRTMVIAEDNPDIRTYLKNEFSDKYNVVLSNDGKEAYSKILSVMPDIVVSDVIMPEMDGLQLCKKIRNNPNVSHIPIVLLTARALDQDQLEGIEVGADVYITKPFNIKVLRQTVSNLLDTRAKLKVSYSEAKIKDSDIKDVEINSPDDRLVKRIIKILNDNISNPMLTVEDLASQTGISRVHLHRKLKELTNQTPRDFIRNTRLKKAAEMLAEKKHSIAELSDAVGFSNPDSFTVAFKELFGVTPTEYRDSTGKK